MQTSKFNLHPLCSMFPPISEEELSLLANSIRNNGLREPIVTFEGMVLDGQNRLAACEIAGVEPKFTEFTGDNPLDFVLDANLYRRHLNTAQKAQIASRLATLTHGGDRKSQSAQQNQVIGRSFDLTIEEAAKRCDTSTDAVVKYRRVESSDPDLAEKAVRGLLTLNAAVDLINSRDTAKSRSSLSNAWSETENNELANPAEAVVTGDNSDLIFEVCRLYLKPEDRIADLTYGNGVFWRRVGEDQVTGSDLITVPERPYDFRSTPYADSEFDIAVFDPPYIHSPGNHMTDRGYKNTTTTEGMLHRDIRRLYVDGMKECARIAKRQIWVKCKDQVQSGMQRWAHCEMLADALNMGLFARDLFILLPTSQTSDGRWDVQHHARKPHSYLWIFEHPSKKTSAQITREKILESLVPVEPLTADKKVRHASE